MITTTHKPVVCFVTGSAGDWGGASRVLFTNIRRLDRSRIEPLLLLPRHGPIVAELDRLGLRYRIWGSPVEPASRIAYLRALFRTLMLFRREKVALVHFNHRPWRPAEALAARILGIPILLHYHVVNEAETPTDKIARGVVTVSDYVRRASMPESIEKFVIHNPVDIARFAQGRSRREEFGIAPGRVVVSFIGQMRDIKGVQDFIAAARAIDDPELVFLLAGRCRNPDTISGAYTEADLEAIVGGDPRIRYLGYIERVEDIYETSDIIVVPSRKPEPLGLIALEAGACGKPVIATRVGGLPEIVEDGVTGYLVDPACPQALRDAILRLAGDAALRKRLGESGRNQVTAQFTQQPIDAFQNLLLALANK